MRCEVTGGRPCGSGAGGRQRGVVPGTVPVSPRPSPGLSPAPPPPGLPETPAWERVGFQPLRRPQPRFAAREEERTHMHLLLAGFTHALCVCACFMWIYVLYIRALCVYLCFICIYVHYVYIYTDMWACIATSPHNGAGVSVAGRSSSAFPVSGEGETRSSPSFSPLQGRLRLLPVVFIHSSPEPDPRGLRAWVWRWQVAMVRALMASNVLRVW